jgi:hypothetical protein
MNKKSNIMSVVYFLAILFLIILIGFGLAIGSMVINWTFDEAMPEFTSIGMMGETNMSEISEYTLTPVNTFVQSFTFMSGVFMMLGLIAVLGFAFAFRFTGNKWLAGFFIAGMLMLVMASIFISNIYEDFYDDSGETGDILKEHTMLSFLLINAPMIITIIGFIGGIILFTGDSFGGEQY